jgi:hypothetical protein
MKLVILTLIISLTRALQSDEQCYNVTCGAMSDPADCVKTNEVDKTIIFNSIYCSNGKKRH